VAQKNEIHNTDLQTSRIGGETLPEPLPVAPFDFIDTISFSNMMKRE
jgi:hypothetical protein